MVFVEETKEVTVVYSTPIGQISQESNTPVDKVARYAANPRSICHFLIRAIFHAFVYREEVHLIEESQQYIGDRSYGFKGLIGRREGSQIQSREVPSAIRTLLEEVINDHHNKRRDCRYAEQCQEPKFLDLLDDNQGYETHPQTYRHSEPRLYIPGILNILIELSVDVYDALLEDGQFGDA